MENINRLFLLWIAVILCQFSFAQEARFFNNTEAGVQGYMPLFPKYGYTIRTVNGYAFDEKIFVGLGLAYDKYVLDEDPNLKAFPVFVQGKYIFSSHRRKSFFGAFDIGYGFSFPNKKIDDAMQLVKFGGGVMYSPQIGFRTLSKNKNYNWSISFGYRIQEMMRERSFNSFVWWDESVISQAERGQFNGYDNYEKTNYALHRFSLTLGFGF